jgi:hypothetical protein
VILSVPADTRGAWLTMNRAMTENPPGVPPGIDQADFCSACGSSVFWQPERMPQLIGIAVGAFADPSFPPPEQSVFTTYKHGCLSLREKMPAFAIMRPRPDREV